MTVRSIARVWLCSCVAMAGAGVMAAARGMEPAPVAQAQVGTPELLFDQGKREFEAFHYDQAVPLLDELIKRLSTAGQKPELLAQAYELRARAKFNLGDSAATEQDFSALLLISPSYKLGDGISPRIHEIFDSVKKITVGQATASMTPDGEIQIDGRPYAIGSNPQPIDLPVGEHTVTVTRAGYRPISQKFTIAANEAVPLALTLERVSSTLAVISVPEGVDVILDGTPRGQTARMSGATDGSATLMLTDLQTGPHHLLLKRECFRDIEQTITIEHHGDLKTDPLKLVEAVAHLKLTAAEPNTTLVVDGVQKGLTPPELTVCEGTHVVEVRGAKGRFVDRREWKTGDTATLTADLRSAFPIVAAKAGAGLPVDQLRANVERALAPVRNLLVYSPADAELTAAMRDALVPPDWLAAELGGNPSAVRVPMEVKRDLVKKLAARLQVQGLAAVSTGQDPYMVTVLLFAAGSGEPDVISLNLSDNAARGRALDLISTSLPPLLRPSLETAVVDLAGVQGAVVIRADGVGAKMGLEAGDVIVSASGTPVASVADFRAKLAQMRGPATDISLDVKKGPGGPQRTLTGNVTMVPETLPLQDPGLLYNRALIALQDASKTATSPIEKGAIHVNLAIVLMRLGNYEDALAELAQAKLPDGAGVSAGTVSYLVGRCEAALGHAANAAAAFTKAAAAPKARLSAEGPLVAPLALQRLHPRGGH